MLVVVKLKGKLGAKLAPRKGSKGMASASRKIPADLTDKMTKRSRRFSC